MSGEMSQIYLHICIHQHTSVGGGYWFSCDIWTMPKLYVDHTHSFHTLYFPSHWSSSINPSLSLLTFSPLTVHPSKKTWLNLFYFTRWSPVPFILFPGNDTVLSSLWLNAIYTWKVMVTTRWDYAKYLLVVLSHWSHRGDFILSSLRPLCIL